MPGETRRVGRGRERLEAGPGRSSYANNLPGGSLNILILSRFGLTSRAFETGSKRLSQVCRGGATLSGRALGNGTWGEESENRVPPLGARPTLLVIPVGLWSVSGDLFLLLTPRLHLPHPSPMSNFTGFDSVSLWILEFFKGGASQFLALLSGLPPTPRASGSPSCPHFQRGKGPGR